MFYTHAPAAIILYDLTKKDSLTNLNKWCQEIRKSTKNIPILLVGNKCDLPEQRDVSADYVSQLKEQYSLTRTLEISAKTGTHVEEMFIELIKLMINNCKTKL
jgi:GTPase SAR1 family protein